MRSYPIGMSREELIRHAKEEFDIDLLESDIAKLKAEWREMFPEFTHIIDGLVRDKEKTP